MEITLVVPSSQRVIVENSNNRLTVRLESMTVSVGEPQTELSSDSGTFRPPVRDFIKASPGETHVVHMERYNQARENGKLGSWNHTHTAFTTVEEEAAEIYRCLKGGPYFKRSDLRTCNDRVKVLEQLDRLFGIVDCEPFVFFPSLTSRATNSIISLSSKSSSSDRTDGADQSANEGVIRKRKIIPQDTLDEAFDIFKRMTAGRSFNLKKFKKDLHFPYVPVLRQLSRLLEFNTTGDRLVVHEDYQALQSKFNFNWSSRAEYPRDVHTAQGPVRLTKPVVTTKNLLFILEGELKRLSLGQLLFGYDVSPSDQGDIVSGLYDSSEQLFKNLIGGPFFDILLLRSSISELVDSSRIVTELGRYNSVRIRNFILFLEIR